MPPPSESRVLLDENIPRQMKAWFMARDARTVRDMGWNGKRNGELLGLAEREFAILITADRGLPHQQALAKRSIAVVVLPTNRRRELEAMRERIEEAVRLARPGAALVVPR